MSKALQSCSCKVQKRRVAKRSGWTVLMGILIAVLPKCPFCILAYSSAITMCGVNRHTPEWTSWISIALAALTLLFILLNNRGARTILASILVVIGSGFILSSELVSGSMEAYYWGVGFLLAGVWTNASLYYFLRKLKEKTRPFWVSMRHHLPILSTEHVEGHTDIEGR